MENRGIEIAQKKARDYSAKVQQAGKRHQPGKGHQAGFGAANSPMFFEPPDRQAPPARFPSDIRPERRPIMTPSTLAFALAVPEVAAPLSDGIAPPVRGKAKPVKARKKRRAAPKTARPRSKAKTARAVAKVAAKGSATKAARPAEKEAARPATLVADVTPPVVPTATAPGVEQSTAPLPRARAVAVYRKNGLLDVIGYWLRSGWSGLAAPFHRRRTPSPKAPPVAQILAENAALRKEVARLRALQGVTESRARA